MKYKYEKEFEEWYNSFEQKGAFIIGKKAHNEGKCKISIAGTRIEILFVLEEIIREISKTTSKEIMDKTYEMAFIEEE